MFDMPIVMLGGMVRGRREVGRRSRSHVGLVAAILA